MHPGHAIGSAIPAPPVVTADGKNMALAMAGRANTEPITKSLPLILDHTSQDNLSAIAHLYPNMK